MNTITFQLMDEETELREMNTQGLRKIVNHALS